MCTAVSYKPNNHYFGRTLDLEYSYNETITVMPRRYPLIFRKHKEMREHFAMIGIAYVQDGYPLYYDAVNEVGLAIAGLNFPGNAYYQKEKAGKNNIAPFEFIPYILGSCSSVEEAEVAVMGLNLIDVDFSSDLPLTPLHWMVSDKNSSIVIEPLKDGIRVYKNEIGVLTNNPPFEYQIMNLNNYINLSTEGVKNTFSSDIELCEYSRGMGAIGLPGDLSSQSRFVRASFVKLNSVSKDNTDIAGINQFFHILGSVDQIRGCVMMDDGRYEITVYASCCDTEKGIYYYKTYENGNICGVDMKREALDSDKLVSYPMIKEEDIYMQN